MINFEKVTLSEENVFYLFENRFSGFLIRRHTNGNTKNIFQILDGIPFGTWREYDSNGALLKIEVFEYLEHGYCIEYFPFGDEFSVKFKSEAIEVISVNRITGQTKSFKMLDYELEGLIDEAKNEITNFERENDGSFIHYYRLQEALVTRIIKENKIDLPIKYIAGADVAYDEESQHMVAGLVVFDADSFEVVEEVVHIMDITFPYIPGLFSFREVPPLLEAFSKLKIKPDLIVCDGHGVAHPKGVGLASHLGLELDIPTIGCAESRLVGSYKPLANGRGAFSPLIIKGNEVGRVLRTQDNVKPMYVSVGHRISLDTACNWVLRLCVNYRQPETTRAADSLVRKYLKNVTDVGYPEE